MKAFLLLLLISLCSRNSNAQIGTEFDYSGQQVPDTLPRLFAPGNVSTNMNEFNATFSPDGSEFYFSIRTNHPMMVICCIKKEGSGWTKPELLDFSTGKYMDADPFLTKDGKTLYFCSTRPAPGRNSSDWNIWKVRRTTEGWTEPEFLKFNTHKNEMYVSLADNGNIYFHSDYLNENTALDMNQMDIYYSRNDNSIFQKPERVSEISSKYAEWDPFVAPDESYIIFTSTRPGGFGSGDLYISFRKKEGGWSSPRNMGLSINSKAQDYCPNLSPDGRYLFFSSYRSKSLDEKFTYNDLMNFHSEPQNGMGGDIYWVDVKVIESLR